MPDLDSSRSRGADRKELLTLMETATACFVVASASCTRHAMDFDFGTLRRVPADPIDGPIRLRLDGPPSRS